MENLSKQQIVLLALLVSFVTSIATGILTVSLLEEASPVVSQTVNRVVERTVERVVPQVVTEAVPGKTVVERETIVVKEDELIPASVEKNGPAIVRVFKKGTDAGSQESFVTLGVIVSKTGSVLIPDIKPQQRTVYRAVMSDKSSYELVLSVASSTTSPFILFSPAPSSVFVTELPMVSLGRSDSIRLGQTVIGLGGAEKNEVAVGIVSSFEEDETARRVMIGTNLYTSAILPGSPLINLNGQVVGLMGVGETSGRGLFLPIDTARNMVAQ